MMNLNKNILIFVFCMALAVAASADEQKTSAEAKALTDIPFQTENYNYLARNASLKEVITAFSSAQNLSIIMAPEVRQDVAVSGDFKSVPPGEFLTRICAMGNLVWYYDNSAVYLYRADQIVTQLVDLQYIHADDVRKMLIELGVEDPRYPISTTHHDELLLVSGPPRYVELILDLVRRADKLQHERAEREDSVMIFRLRHAWADDLTLGAGDKAQTVQGVASLLRTLMADGDARIDAQDDEDEDEEDVMGVANPPENVGYAKLAPRANGRKGRKAKARKEKTGGSGNSGAGRSITADNRTNSVIVRDSRTMMPHYAELVKQLDVPVRLVEIAVTVLDIDESALLDWELRVQGLYKGKHFTYGAGMDAVNTMLPDALTGLGLAGSSIFTGSRLSLLTSLTALTEKSKARTISRPSILTLDNISATMTDTRSYRAKVVGKEVVELAEVSAGMHLNVKPRIIDLAPPAVAPRYGEPPAPKYEIWMMLNIEDGGFESITVDDMPMTRSSTLETQAGVREGESLLIGGYMHENRSSTSWGIPYLRDIPFIGWLFGGYGSDKSRAQRMFLLTPRVITLDAVDLPVTQAVNLRTTDLERDIETQLKQTDREQKYKDGRTGEQEKKKKDEWKLRMQIEKEIEQRQEKELQDELRLRETLAIEEFDEEEETRKKLAEEQEKAHRRAAEQNARLAEAERRAAEEKAEREAAERKEAENREAERIERERAERMKAEKKAAKREAAERERMQEKERRLDDIEQEARSQETSDVERKADRKELPQAVSDDELVRRISEIAESARKRAKGKKTPVQTIPPDELSRRVSEIAEKTAADSHSRQQKKDEKK